MNRKKNIAGSFSSVREIPIPHSEVKGIAFHIKYFSQWTGDPTKRDASDASEWEMSVALGNANWDTSGTRPFQADVCFHIDRRSTMAFEHARRNIIYSSCNTSLVTLELLSAPFCVFILCVSISAHDLRRISLSSARHGGCQYPSARPQQAAQPELSRQSG